MAKGNCEKNPFVSLGVGLGGIIVAIVAIVIVLGREQAWVLAPIAVAIALMGIFIAYFASKKK